MNLTDKQKLAEHKYDIEARIDDLIFQLKRDELDFQGMAILSLARALSTLIARDMARCKSKPKRKYESKRYEV